MTKAVLNKILTITTETNIAKYFGISASAVNQWHSNGIPDNRILGLEKLVNKQVTRHEMNPLLYPVE